MPLAGILLLVACGPTPTPSASHTPQAAESSAPAVIETEDAVAADSCTSIDLASDTATGVQLGTCFSEALHLLGTFRVKVDSGDQLQIGEVRLLPDVAIHGKSTGTNPHEAVFIDDVAYLDNGTGWVRGDPDSDDFEEVTVGNAGRLMVAAFSGDVLRESVKSCPLWNVLPGTEKLTLPDDMVVDARVFECAAPYQVASMTITDSRLLFAQNWTPVSASYTTTGFGMSIPAEQWWYDFGADLKISAPF